MNSIDISWPKTALEFVSFREEMLIESDVAHWWHHSKEWAMSAQLVLNLITFEGGKFISGTKRCNLFSPNLIYANLTILRVIMFTAYHQLDDNEKMLLRLYDFD